MRAITVAVAMAALLTISVLAEEAIPTRFAWANGEQVIWISASEAITPEGSVRPGVLRPADFERIDERRKMQAEKREPGKTYECDVEFFGRTEFSHGWPVRSLEELQEAASTRRIISGKVVASAVGFHGGTPHTVLQIDSPAEGVVHLLYPSGRLHFEDMTVCNRDPGYAPLPEVGDRIAFIEAAQPHDSTVTLHTTDGSWIFYEHAGAVVTGLSLQKEPRLKSLRSLDDVVAMLLGERPDSGAR